MLKENMLELFKEKEVEPRFFLLSTWMHEHISKNWNVIEQGFLESFKSICQAIQEAQSFKSKGPIAYINYSVLRSSWLQGKSDCLISAYDDSWYMDKHPCETMYDAGWLFDCIHNYASELNEARRSYQRKVTSADIHQYKMEAGSLYSVYLTLLARRVMEKAALLPEFAQILKAPRLDVRVGEFMDLSESVFLLDSTPKDAIEVKITLEQHYDFNYVYQYYCCLDLSQGQYTNNNFTYSIFDRCNMEHGNFSGTNLIGTVFRDCCMPHASLQNTVAWGAVFCRSDLSWANLSEMNAICSLDSSKDPIYLNRYLIGAEIEPALEPEPETETLLPSGLPMNAIQRKIWERERNRFRRKPVSMEEAITSPLFRRMDFQGAKLQNANLSNGNFTGASFLDTDLTDCDFSGSDLTQALIPKSYQHDKTVRLSDEQRRQICWV